MSYGYGQGGYGQGGYGQGGYGRSDPYAQSNPYAQQPPQQPPQQQRPPQSNPYGGRQQPSPQQSNPYARTAQNNAYAQPQSRPAPPYSAQPAQQYANAGYGQQPNEMEMGLMNNQQAPGYTDNAYGGAPPAPGANVLDECRRINEGCDEIEKSLARLENAQRRALNDTVTDRSSPAVREVDTLNADIMSQYRNLLDKMKHVKSQPTAGTDLNQKHIGLADRKLQSSRQRFMKVESEYQRRMREQTERQYRTAFPEATPEEVRQACEDPNQQVFAQALMNRDRRGESRQVLGAVRDRHEAIQKIERQMIELAELFNDMERMVVEQEPMVQAIETGAEETHTNMVQANTELVTATNSARAARKKKWICFWIVVILIIVIIAVVIIVLATQGVFKPSAKPANRMLMLL